MKHGVLTVLKGLAIVTALSLAARATIPGPSVPGDGVLQAATKKPRPTRPWVGPPLQRLAKAPLGTATASKGSSRSAQP